MNCAGEWYRQRKQLYLTCALWLKGDYDGVMASAIRVRNFFPSRAVTVEIEPQTILLWGKVCGVSGLKMQVRDQCRKLLALWVEGDAGNRLLIEVRQ